MPKKDLRQMKKSKADKSLNKEEIREVAQKANIDIGNLDAANLQDVQDTLSQYENKSETELMSDLERMIVEGRRDGTFSDEMLDAFVKNVSPMMDDAQRQRLEAIARMIRINRI